MTPRATVAASWFGGALAFCILSAALMGVMTGNPLDFWYLPYALAHDAIKRFLWYFFSIWI